MPCVLHMKNVDFGKKTGLVQCRYLNIVLFLLIKFR